MRGDVTYIKPLRPTHKRRVFPRDASWCSINPPANAPPIGEILAGAPYELQRCKLHGISCPACGRFIDPGHCFWLPQTLRQRCPWLCYECGLGVMVFTGHLPDECLGRGDRYNDRLPIGDDEPDQLPAP